MDKCIDISAYQGVVPTDVWMKSRIKNIIIRSSYTTGNGIHRNPDKCFHQNIVNAYKANAKIGVYHFSQAVSEAEAVEDARCCLDVIKPYRPWVKLPVAIDWEFYRHLNSAKARSLGKQKCKQIIDAFCHTVADAGYTPMVYANTSTLQGYIADDIYKSWKIWVAQYANRCEYKHPIYIWQYTSSGKVRGISGKVDLDYIYDDELRPQGTTYAGKLPTLPMRGWFTSGDKGVQVQLLQCFLNWYFRREVLDPDGEVGRLTINCVLDYERNESLKIDGAFGSQCLERAKIVRR